MKVERGLGFALGLGTAVTLGGTGVAVAAIPSTSTGKITGCVNKRTAVVRIIDYQAGKRCTGKERMVTWNQKGVTGAQGVSGARGTAGTEGSSRCQWHDRSASSPPAPIRVYPCDSCTAGI